MLLFIPVFDRRISGLLEARVFLDDSDEPMVFLLIDHELASSQNGELNKVGPHFFNQVAKRYAFVAD